MKLFLHMPKCAGTSVLRMIKDSVQEESLIEDNNSYFKIPQPQRSEKILASLLNPVGGLEGKLIYGHFFPVKYIGDTNITNFKLVTILRDPIDRLKSHFTFWNSGDFSDHYLWQKMKSERWDFYDFAFSNEMKDFYSQYFDQITLGNFSYIGLHEKLNESAYKCFEELSIPYNFTHEIPHLNATQYNTKIVIERETLERLKEHHFKDYMIYEFAKRKFHT